MNMTKPFRSARNFSAWIELVPKQHSSGGKDRLGSKRLPVSLFAKKAATTYNLADATAINARAFLRSAQAGRAATRATSARRASCL
jgi:transposase